MHPAILGIIAAAGVGAVALLVKDFRIWRDHAGEWGFETYTSVPGMVIAVGLAVGAWWLLSQQK